MEFHALISGLVQKATTEEHYCVRYGLAVFDSRLCFWEQIHGVGKDEKDMKEEGVQKRARRDLGKTTLSDTNADYSFLHQAAPLTTRKNSSNPSISTARKATRSPPSQTSLL